MAGSAAPAANPFLQSSGGTNPFLSSGNNSGPNPFLKSSGGTNPFLSSGSSGSSAPSPTVPLSRSQLSTAVGNIANGKPASIPSQAPPAGSWAAAAAAPNTPSATTQPGPQSTGGGLFHNIINGASNLYHKVGGALAAGIDSEQTDMHNLGNFFQHAVGLHPSSPSLPTTIPFVQAAKGFANPHAQAVQHEQMNNAYHVGPVGRFAQSVVEDPATYTPVGPILRATGITPALKFGLDLAKGTVKTGKEAATAGKVAGEAVKTAPKTPSPFTHVAAKLTENAPGRTEKVASILQKRASQSAPKLSAKQAALRNEQAGLNNGYKPAMNTTTKTKLVPQIAPPGKYATNSARVAQALNEALQHSHGLNADKLKSMIPPKPTISLPFTKVHQMRAAGVYPQDIAPHVNFKTILQEFDHPVHTEPNFQTRGGQLMVIPHAAEKAAEAAPAATNVAGKGPYAKYAWQSHLAGPTAQKITEAQQHWLPHGIPGVKASSDALSRVFTTLPGTRDYFKQGVSKMYGARASGANQINTQLRDIFKGTTPEQRTALTHALESTTPGTKLSDPKLEELRQKVEPLLNQAEGTARSKGLLDKSLNLNDMGVQRYLPHIVTDKLNPEGYAANGRLLKASIDANKERTIPGTIKDINTSGKANFETDALKVLGYHLHQLNNASTAKDLINKALEHAVEPTKAPAGMTLAEYTHDGQNAHLPADEVDYLKGLTTPKSETQQTIEKWGNRYRQGVNLANQAMFASNPLIHVANNLGWQTLAHAPGAFPNIIRNIPEAFKGVQPGSQMDKALSHGAMNLSSEIGTKGTTAQRVNELTHAVDHPFNWRNPVDLAKGAFKQYTHLTPTLEKAYRAGMFQHATENMGKTPEQASEYIRSIYGGHLAPNTASLAEKSARSIMPFINWTKTAIGSNIKNAGERPAVYSAVTHGLNTINQANTGHGQMQNQNPLYTALPETNAQGFQKYYEPYFPAMDVAKLAKSEAQQGPLHGTLDFLFTRANPLVKYPFQEGTNLQNPFAAPNDQYKVDPYAGNPLIPQWAHNQANTNQFLQDFSLQGVGPKQTNVTPLDNILKRIAGGTVNAPNPQSPAKAAKYNQRTWKSQYKSWSKKQAQGNQ